MLEVTVGKTAKWQTLRGGLHALRLGTRARSLPEKLGSWETPGEGRRIRPCKTLTWIVSSLVRKLGCVQSQALVKNGRLKQENFTQKKALSCYLRNSGTAAG